MEDKVDEIKHRVEKIEAWKSKTETRIAIVEADVKTVKKQLGKIESNTTWLLRLIVGAILLALLRILFESSIIL
ncbi:hemolysin XhlA family protein [Salibacterium lacus]|uniref:Hemolysin XhlA family protein n=1 Tax=Salibacterium lacus TaxID=1898109 RepID=A0ABW5SXS9_9BACI